MNIKKTAKKIAAVSAGMGLAGATLMSALAAAPDLADYPSDFIVDGEFDGKIVVGAAAASQDIIGAIDIASSLQAASTTEVAIDGTSTTVIEGDAAQVGETSDILEIGEYIGSVTESLAEGDLAMLESGRVTTSKGSTAFSQTLELEFAGVATDHGSVVLDENDDDETDYYLYFNDGDPIFNYELEFTSGFESDVDSDGIADDLEDEAILMLGQYYSVVRATVTNDGGNDDLLLELIAGDVTDTLEEGQTKTYSVDGVDYEVTVLVVGTSGTTAQVKFLVNGEVTDSLEEGDTDTLNDGLEIGVREVIETDRSFEGDTGSVVEFYLGANKIEFDVDQSGSAGQVEINRENIEDASVTISYTSTFDGTSGELRVSNIQYRLEGDSNAGSDIFVAAGEGVRQHLDEPEGMLNAEWDIDFAGVSEPSVSEIEFRASGDEEYDLTFENRKGEVYSFPYATTDGTLKFGDQDDDFVFFEYQDIENISASDFLISEDDYFLLSEDAGTNQGDSYIFQWDDIDVSDTTLSFSNVATGDNKEVQFDASAVLDSTDLGAGITELNSSNLAADINVGGQDFSIWIYNASDVYTLAVDTDNGGTYANATTPITVKGGGILDLYNNSAVYSGSGLTNTWFANLTTDSEDVDNDVDQSFRLVFTENGAATELDVALGTSAGTFYEQDLDSEDRTYAVTGYGAWVDITDETDESDSVKIWYPMEQVEALVYVTGGDVQSSSVSSGSTATQVNVLPVGIAVLDSEVSYDQDNMIVVGGPCANSVAAELLGNPSDCAEGFSAGMGMIQSFDTGDNFAILVAGFSARDTVESSRVLARAATEDVPSLEGDSVEVVIAGENDISVRAPVEAPVVADEEPEAAPEADEEPEADAE